MIVARITDQLRNRNAKTPGSCRLEGYAHWFPLASAAFSFSFGSTKSKSTSAANAGGSGSGEYGRFLPSEQPKAASEPENVVRCGKYVDVASSALMYLSVFDKLKDRNGQQYEAEPLAADIHFVEVAEASLLASKKSQSPVTAFLKVALEEVTVNGWSLDGSGDERPQESFELKFEKIAMQYLQHDDKGNLMPVNAKGFDQTNLNDWIPDSWKGNRR